MHLIKSASIKSIAALSRAAVFVKTDRLPGPDANMRLIGLQPTSEVLCFQRPHLIAGALRACESSARERKTVVDAHGISYVFLCIFLVLQREMRG